MSSISGSSLAITGASTLSGGAAILGTTTTTNHTVSGSFNQTGTGTFNTGSGGIFLNGAITSSSSATIGTNLFVNGTSTTTGIFYANGGINAGTNGISCGTLTCTSIADSGALS